MAKPRILIVEDDPRIAYLVGYLLQREGYETETAADGKTAVERVEQGPPPSLVLLDIMLPYVDGFQILERLRASESWKDVPVVLLSAKNQERDVVRALELGASDYVQKPFQPRELVARVQRLLKPGS
jgi:DNA-binding response OmpR family regulator